MPSLCAAGHLSDRLMSCLVGLGDTTPYTVSSGTGILVSLVLLAVDAIYLLHGNTKDGDCVCKPDDCDGLKNRD